MQPMELALMCKKAIEAGRENVQLVLPRRAGGGRRVVVFKKPRLYGELCCENSKNEAVVLVNAIDLLAWLAATGLVAVDAQWKGDAETK